MAKDGTQRGGARVGSGRKSSKMPPLIGLNAVQEPNPEENNAETSTKRVSKSQSKTAKSAAKKKNADIPELEGADVPPVDEFLRARQQCKKDLKAEQIFEQTMKWLSDIKCAGIVSKQLVEQYAMSVARWIQTEELISECGFLAKHPTTGQAIASPYVLMSQNYMKQVNQVWYQIYQIVKENCAVSAAEISDDPMERLLRQRGG
ncbi:MAG: P27 family phage terminase small subunit [Lachnospiraceae bacterium]|nr:P27 family phage terminase small subunit [Ruminococcus sp.]MCM1276327.1 P27 family phage terminase small subunit [Lachnospiraceae bacterium]